MNVTLKDLLDAGVHFGHQTKRWNPRSKGFVFDHRQGISIIDLTADPHEQSPVSGAADVLARLERVLAGYEEAGELEHDAFEQNAGSDAERGDRRPFVVDSIRTRPS